MKPTKGVSPSEGNQGTTRGKEKILLNSVGIEPTTFGLDPPLLCRLSYEAGQRKKGTISSCGCLIPFTRANAQWVFHGFHIAL